MTVAFLSPTAPVSPFCRINGGPSQEISGPPWTGPDETCSYEIGWGIVTEPKDVTIDIDLGGAS
jgi:hypothetical protein